METQLKLNVAGLDFVPYIPYSQISRRVEELGTELNQDYEGLSPIFLPILNGSFMFAADLIKEICIPCQVSFVKIASYEGTQSSGKVSQLIGLQQDLEGRHIILVEDIVDTGLTMASLLKELENFRPASVKIATLFVKPESLKEEFEIHYRGFDIPNKFIVGYGLDYEGFGRNYRDVYCLSPD
jgi:hypoxanthine phosphoribosyltransferase